MKAQKYFNSLNYSLGNEDTRLEGEIIAELKPKKVVSICGSGSRCLPLIHEELEELILSDVSEQQLWLAQLRVQTIKTFSNDEFKLFWGYAPYRAGENRDKRKQLFRRLDLEASCAGYFIKLFERLKWNSALYDGKWEKTFIIFSKLIKKIMSPKVIEKMFSFETIEDQCDYFENKFPRWKWNILINILGNKKMFNVLLYKGDFVKKNSSKSYFRYYKDAFDHIFKYELLRHNFFIQLCCFGYIKFETGNLYEATDVVFNRMKNSLEKVQITYAKQNVLDVIEAYENIDFISFSDVPSYFSGQTEKEFLQNTRKNLSPDATIVIRHYLRKPDTNREGYKDISSDFADLIHKEQLQMYEIEVLRNE